MAASCRSDDTAHHHRHRRQDGQDRAGRRLAQRGPAVGLRLLAVLAQCRRRRCRALRCPPSCRLPKSSVSRLWKGRSSTKPRRSWRTRRRGCAAGTGRCHRGEAARGLFERSDSSRLDAVVFDPSAAVRIALMNAGRGASSSCFKEAVWPRASGEALIRWAAAPPERPRWTTSPCRSTGPSGQSPASVRGSQAHAWVCADH